MLSIPPSPHAHTLSEISIGAIFNFLGAKKKKKLLLTTTPPPFFLVMYVCVRVFVCVRECVCVRM